MKNTNYRYVAALLFLAFADFVQAASPNPDLTAAGAIAALKVDTESSPLYSLTYNLGPTGLRGWIYIGGGTGTEGTITVNSRQILVTVASAPGNVVLAKDDVILGAMAGSSGIVPLFSSDCRKAFGVAIGNAEKTGAGTLRVKRWRAGVTNDVNIAMTIMGDYTDTAPYNCPKSALILANARTYLVTQLLADPDYLTKDWKGAIAGLALLGGVAPGDPNYATVQTRLQSFARALAGITLDSSNVSTWNWGYVGVFLSEYYLSTGDATVVNGLNNYTVQLARIQSRYGTYGHAGSVLKADGSLHGTIPPYGPVNQAGIIANMAIVLGKKALQAAGRAIDSEIDPAIQRGSDFFAWFVNKGSIPYGEHEPSSSNHASNGKDASCAVLFGLQSGRAVESEYFTRMAIAGFSGREYGHTGQGFSYLWGAMGANMGGQLAVAKYLENVRWHLDLERRTDGSFVYDGGEQYGPGTTSGGTYLGASGYNGMSPTATYILTYGVPLQRLYITGKNAIPANTLDAATVTNALAAATIWPDIHDKTKFTNTRVIAAMSEYDPVVRYWAARELGGRTLSAAELTTLRGMVTGTNANARMGACQTLGILQDATALPLIIGRLNKNVETNTWVRGAAATAIRSYTSAAASAQLTAMLIAFAANATDPEVIDWIDPVQISNRYLSLALFGNAVPDGSPGNDVAGYTINAPKSLLYPAVKAGLKQPDSYPRSGVAAFCKDRFTLADVQALIPDLIEVVETESQADTMWSMHPRAFGIATLAKYKIREGIPLALAMQVVPTGFDWSAHEFQIPGLDALSSYGDASRWTLPTLRGYLGTWDPESTKYNTLVSRINSIEAAITASAQNLGLAVANSQTVATTGAKAITLTGTSPRTSVTFTNVTAPAHGTLTGTAPNLTYTPNAGYTGPDCFTFQVTDVLTTSEPGTVSVIVPTAGKGLKGEYYDNSDFTNLKLTRTDAQVNFDWGTGSPTNALIGADTFSVRWSGFLLVPETGTYMFSTLNSDGVRLYVNGVSVIDDFVDQSTNWKDGAPINLTAGQLVDLQMQYYENTGSAVAKLKWTGPSFAGANGSIIAKEWLYDGTGVTNRIAYAYSQSVSMIQNTAKAVTLLGSGGTLTYSIITSPAHGTLTGTAPNLTYTPAANYSGTDSFTFMVSNDTSDSTPATVSIGIWAGLPVDFIWATTASGNWSGATAWKNAAGATVVPDVTGQPFYRMSFKSGTYTATNDLNTGFRLNQLTVAGAVTLAGTKSLAFTANGSLLPQFNQNSYNPAMINVPLSLTANTLFGGTYGGQVDLVKSISGTGGLTKENGFTLKIYGLATAPNTYSGGTIVNSGTLHLGASFSGSGNAANPLGTGPVTLNNGTLLFERVTAINALTVNGGTLHCQNGWGTTWSGPITLNATLTANTQYKITLSGNISGAGGFTKTGNDWLMLSGNNSFTGANRVTDGRLYCSKAAALGTGPLDITSGALVDLDYTGTRNIAALTYNAGAPLPAGTYGSSASPAANKNNSYFYGTGTVTISLVPTVTTVTSSLNPAAAGASVTFTATVSGGTPAGNVTFYDGATALGSSAVNSSFHASLSRSNLTIGMHTITAQYAGSAYYAASTSAPLSQVVQSTASYWWNTTATSTWATGANWSDNASSGGITGTIPSATESVVFNQSAVNGTETIQLTAATGVAGITFANTGTTTLKSDSATPRALTLGAGGLKINPGAGAVTIGDATNPAKITLGAAQAWSNNSPNTLSILNEITNSTFDLNVSGAGNTLISGTFVGATSGGLTKDGTGMLTINGSASNTYTGLTKIDAGTVQIGKAASLGAQAGAADGTIIASGATLDLAGIATGVGLERLTVSGAGVGGNGAIISSGAIASPFTGVRYLTLAGDTTLKFATRWDVGSTSLSSSLVGGGYTLNLMGPGPTSFNALGDTDLGDINVTLGNGVIFYLQGSTTLGQASKTMTISGGSLLSIQSNATPTRYDKKFALNTGTINVSKTGGVTLPGTISLTAGTSNTITAGSSVSIIASGIISGDGSLIKSGAGSLELSGANTYTNTTTINANGGTLQISGTGTLGSGNYAGAISIGTNATLKYSSSTTQVLSGLISGDGGLTKEGSSTLRLSSSATNSYTGSTTITNGVLQLQRVDNLGNSNATTIVSGTGQLYVSAGGTIANPMTLSGFGPMGSGALGNPTQVGAVRLDGATLSGPITLAGDTRFCNNSSTAAISGKITGGYGIGFFGFNSNNNTERLFQLSNSANTYTGNTTLYSGDYSSVRTNNSSVLRHSASNVLPDTTTVVFTGADADHKTVLRLNGFSDTIAGLAMTGSAAGAVIENKHASTLSTLTIGAGDVSSAFSGLIQDGAGGDLALTKIGAGTLVLTGANTYTGVTTVDGGILLVNNTSGSGTGASNVTVNTGATLGGTGTINGKVTFAAGGMALFTNGSTLTVSGPLVLNDNVVHLLLPANLADGSYTLATYNTNGSSGAFASVPVIDSGSVNGYPPTLTTGGGAVVLNVLPIVHSADYIKADNTTALNLAGSYTTNSGIPGISDTLVIDSTLTVIRTAALGTNLSVRGISYSGAPDFTISATAGKTLTIGNGGVSVAGSTGRLIFNNAVTLGDNQTWAISASRSLQMNGAFSDAGKTFQVTGAGAFDLRGNNTFGPNVTIDSPVYVNNSSATVTLGGANTMTTLIIYAGRVKGATLGNFGEASTFGDGGTSTGIQLGIVTSGVLEYTGLTTNSNRTVNRDARSPASGIDVTTAGQTLTLSANLGSGSQSNGVNNGWVFGGAGNLTLSGVISDATGAGSSGTTVSKTGSGRLLFSRTVGGNTYTGSTTINNGEIQISRADHLGANPTARTAVSGTGQLYVGAVMTIANPMTLSGFGPMTTDASMNPIQLGAVRLDGATLTGEITLAGDARFGNASGNAATISGKITGDYGIGFFGFNTADSAVRILQLSNSANDYTGNTTITSGDYQSVRTGNSSVLQHAASNVLPDTTAVVFTGADADHKSVLRLNGFSDTIAGLSMTGSAAGAVIENKHASTLSTLTIGAGDVSSAFSGLIQDGAGGDLALTKIGAGTLVLTGDNTYTGETTVDGGVLLVNNTSGSGTGTGDVTVNTGATLGGAGTIGGKVTFATGGMALFTNGATLTVSGPLVLNDNVVHLLLPDNLAIGSYTLATYNTTGSSGAFASDPVIDSGSVTNKYATKIMTSEGTVVLNVFAPSADFIKADNTTALNLPGSYTENSGTPGTLDTLVIDSTLTVARTAALGDNLSVLGISQAANTTNIFNIGATTGKTLTIGSNGVTMASTTTGKHLNFASHIGLGDNQTWTTVSGCSLQLTGSGSFNDGGYTLNVKGTGTFDLRRSITFGSNVTIDSAVSVNYPTATVTLGGANTMNSLYVYGGRVKGATLGNFGEASNFGDGGTATAILVGGIGGNGVMEYTGVTDTSNRTVTRDARSPASGIDVTTADQTLTLSGNLGSGSQSNGVNNGWVFGGAGNLTLSGVINNATGAGSSGTTVTKTGGGRLRLSSAGNTYSGSTTITDGDIQISQTNHLGTSTAPLYVSGMGQLYVSAAITIANPMTLSGFGPMGTDAVGNPLQLGSVRLDGATLTGPLMLAGETRFANASSSAATISGKITGDYGIGFFGFNTADSAVRIFQLNNSANDYTGNTALYSADYQVVRTNTSSVLRHNANNVLPDTTTVVFTGADADHKTVLRLNGYSDTIAGLSVNGDEAGAVIENKHASTLSTLTIGSGDVSSAFSGLIQDGAGGDLAITKSGVGTLTLSGANTYTGMTTVDGGVLLVNNTSGSGTGASNVTVNTGATLGGTGTIAGKVTFATGGMALFTSGAPLTFSGPLVLNDNVVHLMLPDNLAIGAYPLATYTASLSGTFVSDPVIDSGSVMGDATKITTRGGIVVLHVFSKRTVLLLY